MAIEFSPANVAYILNRDNRTCCYCGYTSLTPNDILLDTMTGGDIQIDHFIARVNGGKGTRKNGKVSCVFCNGCKGNVMLGTDYWPTREPRSTDNILRRYGQQSPSHNHQSPPHMGRGSTRRTNHGNQNRPSLRHSPHPYRQASRHGPVVYQHWQSRLVRYGPRG